MGSISREAEVPHSGLALQWGGDRETFIRRCCYSLPNLGERRAPVFWPRKSPAADRAMGLVPNERQATPPYGMGA